MQERDPHHRPADSPPPLARLLDRLDQSPPPRQSADNAVTNIKKSTWEDVFSDRRSDAAKQMSFDRPYSCSTTVWVVDSSHAALTTPVYGFFLQSAERDTPTCAHQFSSQ
jgi:hypothetical protein